MVGQLIDEGRLNYVTKNTPAACHASFWRKYVESR